MKKIIMMETKQKFIFLFVEKERKKNKLINYNFEGFRDYDILNKY